MDNAACSFVTGAAIGAGMMCMLDPQTGRRRRALARDKAVRLGHQAQDAAQVVARDMSNRARGLAHGDWSVLAGGRRAMQNPLRGGWSPSARGLMAVAGSGLFLAGLTQTYPTACIMGTVGLLMMAEGITNVGIEDIKHLPEKAACSLGLDHLVQEREQQPEAVGAAG